MKLATDSALVLVFINFFVGGVYGAAGWVTGFTLGALLAVREDTQISLAQACLPQAGNVNCITVLCMVFLMDNSDIRHHKRPINLSNIYILQFNHGICIKVVCDNFGIFCGTSMKLFVLRCLLLNQCCIWIIDFLHHPNQQYTNRYLTLIRLTSKKYTENIHWRQLGSAVLTPTCTLFSIRMASSNLIITCQCMHDVSIYTICWKL